MDDSRIGPVPDALRYRDGDYRPERLRRRPAERPTLRQIRRITRPLRALHTVWFTFWLPHGVGRLTTIGRRSGEPRSTFVKAARLGDTVYLVSIGGEHTLWLKNIRADPRVTLRLRDDTVTGHARDLRDAAERDLAFTAYCLPVRPFDYVENAFHRRGRPSRTKILELHRAWFEGGTPLAIDLRDNADRP
ncbi:nitroreductase family deazaflavin-dependent oxidoreductase [Nocardia asteroides]|uniref:nitroreductase family deazaflavin-dependent oxidoreductase n=1 Tax=Nocardia asteroides TaxID=1824 RepID=UPI00379FED5C